jgi:kynurenine formamidase
MINTRDPSYPEVRTMGKKIIDLTLELYDGLQTWLIHPKVVLIDYHRWWLNKDKYQEPCQGFSTKLLTIVDHVGTHVDAQNHFFPHGKSAERIPLERMMGEAILLDVSFRGLNGPISSTHLEEGLRQSGDNVKEDDILIVRAWPHEWGGDGFHESRGLTPDAVGWILEKNIKMFGMDLAGIDDPPNRKRDGHMKLLEKGIPVVENLINLDKIGQVRFYFIGLPLRLREATGSPIRAIAVIE